MYTEAPQCSLVKGRPLAPCLKPGNRPTLSVGFLRPPQLHTDTRRSVWDQPHSRSPQSPACPTTGAGPGDRSQLRQGPLLWGIPHCLVSPEKMYFPLAIHSGPRLTHSPVSSSTYEPSNKVQDGNNHNLFSHLTHAPHPTPCQMCSDGSTLTVVKGTGPW